MKLTWWLISVLYYIAFHTDLFTKMEKIEAVSHLLVQTGSYWALFLALISILSIVSFTSSKRQRILPNVPIVGLNETKSIRQARENFRNGSKTMLLDGYRKVFL